MTLEEQCRLSYYREIADISPHQNVKLVQHVETRRIYVKKVQEVYNKQIYEYLMRCGNPHIPQIYECMEDDGKLIIIEEYIQGESLLERLEQGGLYSREEVCRIVVTICDVLEQLHQLPVPVIHRDLKPENILLQSNGYLKIIDFNTAKKFEEGREQDTVLIGTRDYAAPEQYGFAQSDARTDIYALGVMMNYLLTKAYPKDFLYMGLERAEDPLTQIIRRCTALDPRQRYQNVMELRQDLQVVLGERNHFDLRYAVPPGFRTKKVWKMLLGSFGYLMIFWMSLTMEFNDSYGGALVGVELWANRIVVLLWMLLTVALATDYMGIQKQFPLMKGKGKKWIGCVLWSFVFLVVLVMLLEIVT